MDLKLEIEPIWWSIIGLSTTVFACLTLVTVLYKRLLSQRSKVRSLSVRHGLVAEQFLPFSQRFPGDPRNFRFLGSPVDGIAFEKDKIIIVEFKSGRSQLSSLQRHIKGLVEQGRVSFQEVRV